MSYFANVLIIVIASLHFYFLVLQMFLWTKPKGLKVFNQSLEQAMSSKILAANQGLYNGFLASGLVWSLLISDSVHAKSVKVFFITCVLLAGLYGGKTVNKKVFFIQGLPALLCLCVVVLS